MEISCKPTPYQEAIDLIAAKKLFAMDWKS